jgi:hypothetical protein
VRLRRRGHAAAVLAPLALLVLLAAIIVPQVTAGAPSSRTSSAPGTYMGLTARQWHDRAGKLRHRGDDLQHRLAVRVRQLGRVGRHEARWLALGARVDGYLARRGSPMAGNGEAFVAAGRRYGVNPRLAVAISAAETTFGLSGGGDVFVRHNAWGWGPGKYVAGTWPEAIDRYTAYLSSYYLRGRGLTTIASMMRPYVGYTSATWYGTVTAIYRELGGDPYASATITPDASCLAS